MTPPGRIWRTGIQDALRVLLLASVLVAGLIPIGFMPGSLSGSSFPIAICHGADAAPIWIDAHGRPAKHQAPPQEHLCAFAPVLGHAPAVTPIFAAVSLGWSAVLHRLPAPVRVGWRRDYSSASPRGPPLPF